ncbi:MAG: hypothetical protein AMXMBFR61_25240 [Fimbriimonadales bacterium]
MSANVRPTGREGATEVIAALAVGKTMRDAATIAGVNEKTLQRYLKDPEFMR